MRQLNAGSLAVMTFAVALSTGCATSGKPAAAAVSDTDFAQLQASQMGRVDEARQAVLRARDEQARAQLRVREADNEDQLAAADGKSAQAATEQATTRERIAAETRDQAKLEQAKTLAQQAAMQRRAADARADYAKKLIDARQASALAADKKTTLAESKLEVAKLAALRNANVKASGKYDMAAFEQRVQQAQAEYDAADQKARDQEWWAQKAERVYGDAKSELQAQTAPAGTPQTGTGSR
jgi:colicin import membrane protein